MKVTRDKEKGIQPEKNILGVCFIFLFPTGLCRYLDIEYCLLEHVFVA